MQCEKCQTEHDGSYGSGRFCKVGCARSFVTKEKREEISAKVSAKLQGRASGQKGKKMSEDYCLKHKWTAEVRTRMLLKLRNIFESKTFDELGFKSKRERILEEQGGKCLCGQSQSWNGKRLVLQLDHINGLKTNNTRENLRLLCPNCHSQTETFTSKNSKRFREKRAIIAQQAGGAPLRMGIG